MNHNEIDKLTHILETMNESTKLMQQAMGELHAIHGSLQVARYIERLKRARSQPTDQPPIPMTGVLSHMENQGGDPMEALLATLTADELRGGLDRLRAALDGRSPAPGSDPHTHTDGQQIALERATFPSPNSETATAWAEVAERLDAEQGRNSAGALAERLKRSGLDFIETGDARNPVLSDRSDPSSTTTAPEDPAVPSIDNQPTSDTESDLSVGSEEGSVEMREGLFEESDSLGVPYDPPRWMEDNEGDPKKVPEDPGATPEVRERTSWTRSLNDHKSTMVQGLPSTDAPYEGAMGEVIPPWTKLSCEECGAEFQATRQHPRVRMSVLCDSCQALRKADQVADQVSDQRIRILQQDLMIARHDAQLAEQARKHVAGVYNQAREAHRAAVEESDRLGVENLRLHREIERLTAVWADGLVATDAAQAERDAARAELQALRVNLRDLVQQWRREDANVLPDTTWTKWAGAMVDLLFPKG